MRASVATMEEKKDDDKKEQEAQQVSAMKGHKAAQIMLDSGAATHVCPPWFADNYPIHKLAPEQGPQLRTVTNKEIQPHGVRWVYYMQRQGQPIVIPFYVCNVHDPILSVTRLAEEGFDIRFNDVPTISYNDTQQKLQRITGTEEQPLLPSRNNHTPHQDMQLQIQKTDSGMIAMIAPTTMTTQGYEQVLGGRHDYWAYNNEGYLVRFHRTRRKSLFVPKANNCPVPLEQLENIDSKKRRQCRRHYRSIQRFAVQDAKARSQWTTMARRKLVQGDSNRQVDRNNNNGKGTTSTGRNKEVQPTSTWETTTTTTAATITTTTNSTNKDATTHWQTASIAKGVTISSATTNGTTQPRLLVQRRTCVEKSSQPRTELYVPQRDDNGPDVTRLLSARQTIIKPTSKERGCLYEDDWTKTGNQQWTRQWTGSTNFEEDISYKHGYIEDDARAKAIPAPKQPTPQERMDPHTYLTGHGARSAQRAKEEQTITHNSSNKASSQWYKQTSRTSKHMETSKSVLPVLTAIAETGMAMAVQVQDKSQEFHYLVKCLQTFLYECGRAQASLSPTTLPSDQEDYLIQLLKATALAMGGNIAVRQSPTYSSQSHGSVERFHRTLVGQMRALVQQVPTNYDINITNKHPILPWIVRHAVYLLNRYAVHNDGQTSYQRRWG